MSYAHPEVLVSTQWVHEHLNDPKTRIVEVDYDPTANYQLGHIPGAVLFDWRRDLNHPLQRDIPTKEQIEELFSRHGISNDTKIVLYGDFNNWFAAYAFWDLQYYGVKNTVLMNGGRKKWIDEDKPLTKDTPQYARATFKASNPDESIRVYLRQALDLYNKPGVKLVDVRSPKEYTGEILAPPEYPTEHAQRGGHIPGAVNIPWSQAVNADGVFKPYDEIKRLYETPSRNLHQRHHRPFQRNTPGPPESSAAFSRRTFSYWTLFTIKWNSSLSFLQSTRLCPVLSVQAIIST